VTEPAAPSRLQRLRARWTWLDHLLRANERYQRAKGDFFAAAITYFTVFALFPLLMVGFSVGGFVLAGRPDLLARIEERIRATVTGEFSEQIIALMDSAIDSRTSVGLIGLAGAAWAGLGWITNLREALSAMWEQPSGKRNFVRTKLSDLLAPVSLFLAILVTFALTALGDRNVMRGVLNWLGMPELPGLDSGLRVVSALVSVLVSWLLFTWVIARLPRESLTLRSAVRAGLFVAVGFEIFKQLGTVYLSSVTNGPAGATFGPVLGLMVFAYITARLILFGTAWAATAHENLFTAAVPAPGPARITVQSRSAGTGMPAALAGAAVGAVAALGLSRLWRPRQ